MTVELLSNGSSDESPKTKDHCPQCGERTPDEIWIWRGQFFCTEKCVRIAHSERLKA